MDAAQTRSTNGTASLWTVVIETSIGANAKASNLYTGEVGGAGATPAYDGQALNDRFNEWTVGLETRHLADLTFSEVSTALRAVSSAYVERRAKLAGGAALSGTGKRAAFALFYGPLHYLLVRHIVLALPSAAAGGATLVDLGCGTGASGAAWASACSRAPR